MPPNTGQNFEFSGGGGSVLPNSRPPSTNPIPGSGGGGGGGRPGGGSGGGFSASPRPISPTRSTGLPPAPPSFGVGLGLANSPAQALGADIGRLVAPYIAGLVARNAPKNAQTLSLSSDVVVRGAYERGIKDGREAAKGIKGMLEKVPQFSIPQVKIPELKLPQIPKIELPKLPELPTKVPELPKLPGMPQIPQIAIPKLPQLPKLPSLKPTPILKPIIRPRPRTKADELRELTPGGCGSVVFKFAYIEEVIGERYDEQTGSFIRITLPVSIDKYLSEWREIIPSTRERTDEELFENGGGFEPQYNSELNYDIQVIGFNTRLSPSTSSVGFPYYRHVAYSVVVRDGLNTGAILNSLSLTTEPQVYLWAVSTPNKEGCFIPPPPPEPLPPNPPPQKDKDCECMCCDSKNNDELLKLVLRRIGSLPAKIPNKLTDRNAGRRTVNSLSEFMAQQVRLLDDLMGYFPLEIEIEDSDLLEQGNQTQRLRIDNVAEALTELIGLTLVLRTESSANLSATLRALVEAGSAKQAAIVAHDYAQANADFLGYELKQVEKEVGFTFTPGKSKIEEILQEAIVKVKSVENVDKETFQKAIYPLLEMAARWNAQNWVNLGRGNAGDALKNIIGNGLNAISDIDRFANEEKQKQNPDKKIKSNFDDFMEEIENGFNTQDGITKPETPYGYPYNERPRIRQLGNTFEEGEDNSQV